MIEETLQIAEVGEKSAAYGKLQTGDVIKSLTVDGNKTVAKRMFQIIDALLYVREGEKVMIEVEREGKSLELEIVFDADDLTVYN